MSEKKTYPQPESEAAKAWPHKRIIVDVDENGESYISTETATNVIQREGFMHRADVWAGRSVPYDNTEDGDLSLMQDRREPYPGGFVARSLKMWPDKEPEEYVALVRQLHQDVGQKHMPSEKDYARHANIHRTDTLDMITVITGEMYMMTDKDEVLMRPGDTVVIKGGNHGWSNRSSEPCLTTGVSIDSIPLDIKEI